MAKYIVKRVAMGIFSVFIVATLTFFIMNLVPGGPFVAEKSISKAAQQALAEKYGLDKPLGVQYLNYMNSLIHGDMGLSAAVPSTRSSSPSCRSRPAPPVWLWSSRSASAFRWAVCPRITEGSGPII